MITLTPDQMLNLWRIAQGFEPLRTDASVTRTDGLDIDTMLRLQMRAWYLKQLDTAPCSLLPVEEIRTEVVPRPVADGSLALTLPDGVRRVVEVQLGGWMRPATIIEADDPSAAATLQRQASAYARGGVEHPVAVLQSRSELRLYPGASASIAIVTLRVVRPPKDAYTLDESLLAPLFPVNPPFTPMP